jgi:hypothetical protein
MPLGDNIKNYGLFYDAFTDILLYLKIAESSSRTQMAGKTKNKFAKTMR